MRRPGGAFQAAGDGGGAGLPFEREGTALEHSLSRCLLLIPLPPPCRRMLLDDRRRVQVDSIEFVNTCRDAGVDFRL